MMAFSDTDTLHKQQAEREAKVFQVSESTGQLIQLDDDDEDEENEDEEDEEEDDPHSQTDPFACSMPRRPNWEESTSADVRFLVPSVGGWF
jgi:hypothetical protein